MSGWRLIGCLSDNAGWFKLAEVGIGCSWCHVKRFT